MRASDRAGDGGRSTTSSLIRCLDRRPSWSIARHRSCYHYCCCTGCAQLYCAAVLCTGFILLSCRSVAAGRCSVAPSIAQTLDLVAPQFGGRPWAAVITPRCLVARRRSRTYCNTSISKYLVRFRKNLLEFRGKKNFVGRDVCMQQWGGCASPEAWCKPLRHARHPRSEQTHGISESSSRYL